MKRTVLLTVAAAASVVSVASAAAGTTTTSHVGIDQAHAVRFSLVARSLTITLDPVAGAPNPLVTTLPGTVVDIACNGLPKHGKRKLGKALQVTWPAGASTLSVRLSNDVSSAMHWCLVERHDNGIDIGLAEQMNVVRTQLTATTPTPTQAPTSAPTL